MSMASVKAKLTVLLFKGIAMGENQHKQLDIWVCDLKAKAARERRKEGVDLWSVSDSINMSVAALQHMYGNSPAQHSMVGEMPTNENLNVEYGCEGKPQTKALGHKSTE
ncbi:hypothetical protein DdX_05063 [Ditylenchus destructor]|uniref:Uncharacterized protein n=1 Tax=Ditylenchus destructor TaxID=166010 RepID=A0AAD4NAL4_9BILA|nr:hypothetical protein DdX_05063 [Ditylenchus destructor]